MKINKTLFIFLGVVIIIFTATLLIFPALSKEKIAPEYENLIEPFSVEVVGKGQFVEKNKDGTVILDGTSMVKVSLNNSYKKDFEYEIFLKSNPADSVKEKTKASSEDVLDFSKIFCLTDDNEYLIVIYAKKIGFNEDYVGKILINTENLSPSVLIFGGEVNPKRIVLEADKDVSFHWVIKQSEINIALGVSEEALNAQLKLLPNGVYEVKNIAILTSKYDYNFEFTCSKSFEISKYPFEMTDFSSSSLFL